MLKTGFGLLKPVLHLKTYKCYTFLELACKAGSNDTHIATIFWEKKIGSPMAPPVTPKNKNSAAGRYKQHF